MPTAATMQRQVSPIPPGRYWMNVIGDLNIREFGDWVRDMAGAVRVETVEEEAPPPVNFNRLPRVLFVIFVVPEGRAPFLDAAHFGFPNFAPAEVTSSQDVIRAPEPEGPRLPSFGELAGGGALLALLVALVLLGNNK